ncbi:serine/threonine-protein kinase ATR-like isoform X1 [Chenopodium quinoa]|uniref:serine/threonine-protein kinase ATR-like isoform X1 n=1 Tax=Chenopodium quinoa TaxID=63459 RepID=UPI000B78E9CB|nr:serine/threonine-protein kinase ATR-like isoform X1 [Chenopodium quinoa]XP_021753009.1 serine/threonine-protein kinase ATR-like isoform X1 [Chenopodium quinoa]XP_021753010.1 serine/threonine-protein kinase ATR-like isoform X1 [Chenopodium quinoa]XP_021753011.1 serine/threonine-protein kinase ATR-like isoform X1 [Chenopodium quinoa]
MASISSLVHELRERFAASSSTPTNSKRDDVALETRFRSVLPNLLNAYVIASPSANEREVIAVLKLLNHTAKNFPGVFYHGKSNAILPVIGRLLPFFAEPTFRDRHGVILETIGSLLALLRSGDQDSYRQFFLDAMLLIEDLGYVGSLHYRNSSITESAQVSLKCFSKSFTEIYNGGALLGDLPECNKPGDGYGILVDLTLKERWTLFSTWIIWLLSKCLTEGTLYVEGLVTSSFILAVCSMLSYEDADLHMACFDFARIAGMAMNYEIVPYEKLIFSIIIILSEADGNLPVFRNMAFDSTIGSCLDVLHSRCPADIVRSTAAELVIVFFNSLPKTKSSELQAALCSAYIRVCRICHPRVWKPKSLLNMICSSTICLMLQDCFEVAISILGPDRVGGGTISDTTSRHLAACDNRSDRFRVDCKRPAEDLGTSKLKRQKTNGEEVTSDFVGKREDGCFQLNLETNREYASDMCTSLLSAVESLKPLGLLTKSTRDELALATLSMFCMVFCKYPNTNTSARIFELIYLWIPWIFQQANQENSIRFDLSSYFEALHKTLLLPSPFPGNVKHFCSDSGNMDLIFSVLKLPWTHYLEVVKTHQPWRTKCLSIQILSLIGPKLELQLDVLNLGLHDAVEEVRMEAVMAMPIIVMSSDFCALSSILTWLKYLGKEVHENVRKVIPFSLGYLSCLTEFCHNSDGRSAHGCKISFHSDEKHNLMLDSLFQGFWCAKCDKKVVHADARNSFVMHVPDNICIKDTALCDFSYIHSLFFNFLFDESSEEVQVSCVAIFHRIIMHAERKVLLETRAQWIKCIEFLLLHKKRSLREAFCSQLRFFLDNNILICLFPEMEMPNASKRQMFFDKIVKALATTEDPQIVETLLESAAEIMMAVDINCQLFLASLILLVDKLDNPHLTVRVTAARLIDRSCYFHLQGGVELVLSKFTYIRNVLFEYLCLRLVNRSEMVREFAEAVHGIETKKLVLKMIPVVLPKLVVAQKNDEQSVAILHELANYLDTNMVNMIVRWLPKVLAYALQQSDGKELLSVLQFYHEQIESDKQQLFAASLPDLLEELVCFVDGNDPEEISQKLGRVPQMIEEVAKTLTGSEDLPSFLKNYFVVILKRIDTKMLQAKDISWQKQAIKRIELLIKLMGPHLSTYVPKLMVLLMHAIEKESLRGEGLAVLHFFIKQLAMLSPSSAKHVIFQVFSALIPFLEKEKDKPSMHLDKIVDVIEELVCENKDILKQHIREFPLLPSIPALIKVNQVIQEARGSMTLKDQLRDAADGLNHENLNVRYMVACELSKLLNLRNEDVAATIGTEMGLDITVLSSLITSLLRGCSEESRTSVGQRLKMVCADCLGALGAVDPAKVKAAPCQRFKIQCSDDDLIFELIHKHLARAFRAAPDANIQDAAAFAIQELLKIAGCNAVASLSQMLKVGVLGSKGSNDCQVMSERGQRLWDRFSDYVKEIIAPCLISRFQLSDASESSSSGAIYQPSLSFRNWIFRWIKKLIVDATGSRASIFKACREIMRHDMQTATYLLPYLVLDVVCHGSEAARSGITGEILSVLDAAASENSGAAVLVIGGGQGEICIQAVFTLLDNMGQWVDDVGQEIALSHSPFVSSKEASKLSNTTSNSAADRDKLRAQCKYVSELLDAIPKVTLARASFRCQAYARSLMYFESHVRVKSGSFNPAAERSGIFEDEDISFLMEIYSGMDEPDGLSGLASLRKSVSLQDQLLINKKAGNWAEVLTSCEQALQMESTSVQRHSDVLNCLLNMCHLQTMVTHVDGLISRIPQYKKTWCMQGVQAAWRLGKWDLMDEYLDGANKEGLLCSISDSNASFDMDVAKILQAIMQKDRFVVDEKIALSKQALIAPLAAAGMDSYARAYPFIVKLHLLRELENFRDLLGCHSFLEKPFHLGHPEFLKVIENWENRLKFTQPSLWAREPLLAFRRLVFGSSKMGAQVGDCWLQYAKLCRSAGHYETANRAILEANSSGAPNVHIEKAKLLWSMKRSEGAIAELQQSLLNMPIEVVGSAAISSITSLALIPPNPQPLHGDTQAQNENRNIGKTLLLYSRWIHYTGQKQKEDVMSLYSRVRELQPKWEKGYFYVAKYCDEVLVDARKRQVENVDTNPRIPPASGIISNNSNAEKPWWVNLPEALLFYAKGLHRGHKNLFQALPRLLTLWFDFGSVYHQSGSSNKDLKNVQGKVMSIMRGCLKDLPTYQWLAVLPQLVSRICHQNEEIVRLVKHIITSVLRQYPQQAIWLMAAVSKSAVPSRRQAAAEILQAARKGPSPDSRRNEFFSQFTSLIDHLIRLCFHASQSKVRTINILTEFSSLKRMMPLGIIMPIQQSLTVNLPTCESTLTDSSNIFSATDLPTIAGIADEVEILSSLQRPKKVVLVGSDGIERAFLCKPKDDLRKDARMMEFNAMINRLLSKCAESRRRKLYIRTFAVIPLTEDCGMVEWVPHTRGLRHILQDIYITCGKFDRQKTNPQIKRLYDQSQGRMPEDEMLKTKILPMFPPVFHKWFLTTFAEPAAWFRARVAYAHTTAVWSMVGHIVGLGDRHGENILFDSTTGDCVHVDFSCLFDKGLLLEKPELVPFRLTQNMIDGLGITGYEGVFLKVCEITLSVLRTHRETLMSVLETFIHDPLVEWTKSHKSSGVEVQNPHAQRAISNIEARLQGIVVGVAAAPSLPLAVEGQARRLTAEAVSHKNLGRMYIWWMPWF